MARLSVAGAPGVYVGSRLFRTPPAQPSDGNPQAQTALAISPRELTVLHELAAGQSNKEIARKLSVSPHTVKTHVARLYEKLEATRRTEAVRKAREPGLIE
jgi:DNA-binding NarL/FixJ family response regulator